MKGAKIIDYKAEYDPESKKATIEITRLCLPNRKHTLEMLFTSRSDSRLAPEIFKFREKYDVCSIRCKINGIEYAEDKK